MIEIVCKYKEKHGVYPEVIRADKIDQTRNNKFYCASLFIRLSGPRLGRKPKDNPMQYIHFMLYNLSLRKIAKKLDISTTTAFAWRHEVTQAIKDDQEDDHLSGGIEMDETYFLLNIKES